ncbi:hypothetical protein DW970_08930 [Clostridium sp. AM48-13]|nr:hypothetical protein DW970_08930 [Clostridium sp. AM48-13]
MSGEISPALFESRMKLSIKIRIMPPAISARTFKQSPKRCPAAFRIMERNRANPKPYLTFTPTKITQILHKRYQNMISVNRGIFYTAYCKKSRIKNSERKKREERGILL